MKPFKILVLSLTILIMAGCSQIFIPNKQSVTFNTSDEKSKVYVNKLEIGTGKTFKSKIKRSGGSQQVIVRTPGFKDQYYVLFPQRRPNAYYPLVAVDIVSVIGLYGLSVFNVREYNYKKVMEIPNMLPYINKKPEQKYISIEAIRLDIENQDKNVRNYYVDYNENIQQAISDEEMRVSAKEKKKELKDAKKNKKAKNTLPENNKIKYDDTKFSYNVYQTLKRTGYIDTVNKVFQDDNNTLQLLGSIRQVNYYSISQNFYYYNKLKVDMVWYIKNMYGEVIDSVSRTDFSGDYVLSYNYYSNNNDDYNESVSRMFADAVDVSFSNLLTTKTFKKYESVETSSRIPDATLKIKKATNVVTDPSEAADACVIVKRKGGGHGSGFAISNDGYILTNFHVIAGDKYNTPNEVSVILSNGEEAPVKVVRYNRMKDIALLKVDKPFTKAFLLKNTKEYKNLLEVYTMGTPKSIELGQTVSLGLLSNERKANNNAFLQLSMAINSGNSGGPLFEKSGKLHGVIQAKLVGYATEGVGFAIPSYLIGDFLNLEVE